MLIATLLVVLPAFPMPQSVAPRRTETFRIDTAPCRDGVVVDMAWSDERRAEVRSTTNGFAQPAYATHEERRIDRAVEVVECRSGVPRKLVVRYRAATERRLDGDPEADGTERAPGTPVHRTEDSPIAGRTFHLTQVGEATDVSLPEGSPAAPNLARLVLEAEGIHGGAVPLPGDEIARALGANPRAMGEAFAFEGHVARALLAGDETGECAATLTFTGLESTADGLARARFDVRIVVHEEQEGGFVRDADLRGTLHADPRDGRPLEFSVRGDERRFGAAADGSNAAEFEVVGTWTVRRSWTWR